VKGHQGTIHGQPGEGYTASCSCGWSFKYPLKFDSHAEGALDLHLAEVQAVGPQLVKNEPVQPPPMAVGATYRLLALEVVYRGVERQVLSMTRHGPLHRFETPDGRTELVADLFLNELRESGLLTTVVGR
jgi:hypothetical protein